METIFKKAWNRLCKWSLLLSSGCDRVCVVNGSVNGSLSSYCDSLFLAKPQVPITNNSDGVYDGAYFYLRIAAVCF